LTGRLRNKRICSWVRFVIRLCLPCFISLFGFWERKYEERKMTFFLTKHVSRSIYFVLKLESNIAERKICVRNHYDLSLVTAVIIGIMKFVRNVLWILRSGSSVCLQYLTCLFYNKNMRTWADRRCVLYRLYNSVSRTHQLSAFASLRHRI